MIHPTPVYRNAFKKAVRSCARINIAGGIAPVDEAKEKRRPELLMLAFGL
jgi:hypothetical protein